MVLRKRFLKVVAVVLASVVVAAVLAVKWPLLLVGLLAGWAGGTVFGMHISEASILDQVRRHGYAMMGKYAIRGKTQVLRSGSLSGSRYCDEETLSADTHQGAVSH